MKKTYLLQKNSLLEQQRDYFETAAARIDLLDGQQRLLLKMYLTKGLSCCEIAKMTGTNSGTLSRRINRLICGVMNKDFALCQLNSIIFTHLEMEIAKDYYVKQISARAIAAYKNMTCYQVSKALRLIAQKIQKIKEANKCRLSA